MFIGVYKLDNKEYFNIYYKKNGGWGVWQEDTFSPTCSNIEILDFKIGGKTYQERKNNLEELAKEWQLHFNNFGWSYGELIEIQNYFYKNAKRYGLLKEFRENGIC